MLSFCTILFWRSNEFELCLLEKSNAGIDFLEFKPSEIAAAVAVSVLRELPAQEIDKTITDFFIVNKVSWGLPVL